MAKRPLMVSVRTVDGREIRSSTVDEALNGTPPQIEDVPPDTQTIVVPVNVAVADDDGEPLADAVRCVGVLVDEPVADGVSEADDDADADDVSVADALEEAEGEPVGVVDAVPVALSDPEPDED